MNEFTKIAARVLSEINTLTSRPVTDNDEEIFVSGILDSLNVLHVIIFMEAAYGITVNPFEINLETLGSVNRIARYIEACQSRKSE